MYDEEKINQIEKSYNEFLANQMKKSNQNFNTLKNMNYNIEKYYYI